ncbi:uncharacterized protein NPIL_180101 [Nephila pilipes]|uniref:DUF7041 domain-containing protein n=1 Tax=Nephila pilipes TaxID=299642 RepID=A0A8X6TDL1_NEPPI|nr:uncharacterized protein NPIL_180101 [Nephila pilipes]
MAAITSESTKFPAVVAALSSKVLSCVKDIIKNHLVVEEYKAVKDRVIQHFARSSSSHLNLLLKDLQLGDKRYFLFLHEKGILAPENREDDILQSLWLQRLSVNLQQNLSVCKAPLEELAQIVDKIHEVSGGNLTIANIESKGPDLNAVLTEVSELKEIIKGAFRPQRRSRRGALSLSL